MSYLPDTELGDLCLSLATLLHSGMDLSYGTSLLPASHGRKQTVIDAIKANTSTGASLSDSLPPDDCPPYMIGLIRMGEESGKLEQALYALSEYYYEKHTRTLRIKSALTYPIILTVLMLAVIGVLLIKILPVFDRVYASLGGTMTGAASVMLQTGVFLKSILPALCVIGGVILILILLVAFVPSLRSIISRFWLTKFGDTGISRKSNDARFAQALSMGLASGMPLDEAVSLAGELNSNIPAAKTRYDACMSLIQDGHAVTDALSESNSLPADTCALLTLGQSSGTLDHLMKTVSARMSEEANQAIDALSAKIEPALVIAASLITGAILIAVMLPLMDIMAAMG